MKKASTLIAGLVFLLLGAILLFKSLGLITFSIWQGIGTYWPVGLILIGIALVFKKRTLALIFLVVTLVTVLLFGISFFEPVDVELRKITQDVPVDEEIKTLEVNLEYGAGNLFISKGDNNSLLKNKVETVDLKDPRLKYDKDGDKATIEISRRGSDHLIISKHKFDDKWDIELSPNVDIDLSLEFGASESDIDLRELKISNLDIETGASDTKIMFGSYPTKTSISTGASNLELFFPKDIGVKIDIESGLTSVDFPGFEKIRKEIGDSTYISPNFNEDEEYIEIEIEAGVASISSEFY